MSLGKSFLEIFAWTTIWFVLSFTYGALFGDHVWMLIPVVGTSYGFVAGITYSAMSFLFRWKKESIGVFVAMIIGLVASLLTAPVLVALGVKLGAAMIFTVVSGAATGVVVNLLTRGKRDHLQAS